MINYLNAKQIALKESFKLIFIAYISFVVISSYISYETGYLGGDLLGIDYYVDVNSLVFQTFLYLSGVIISAVLSLYMINLKFTKWHLDFKSSYSELCTLIVLSITALILISGGAGTIHRDIETNRYSELFLAAFDPMSLNLLLIYYLFINHKHRFLTLASIVYLLLVIRSGLTGYLFFCIPLLMFFLINTFSIAKAKILLYSLIIFVPLIRFLRWVMIIGLEELNDVDLDYDFLISLLRSSIDRFSAVSNMIYISDNSDNLNFFLESKYLPFFQGYFGSFLHKIFFNESVELNTFMLHQIIQNTLTNSNSTFPLYSYYSLSFWYGALVTMYSIFLIFLISRLLCFVYGDSILGRQISSFLLFIVSFIYIFNGWWWAAVGFIQALISLSILMFVFGRLKISQT